MLTVLVMFGLALGACDGGDLAARVDARGEDGGADGPGEDGGGCTLPTAPATCDPEVMRDPNPSCLVEAPGVAGCLSGMVRIEDFCIDQFEASIAGHSPYFSPGATPGPATSRRDAVPQAYITGIQAAASCTAAGKRLCTNTEWLRACRGVADSVYPYGDTRMPGVCNDARGQHPAVEYFGTTDPVIYSMLGHPCLDQLPDSLDRAGANPGCITADGVFDMMGNLHEWTSDPAGTFRGGYFVDTKLNGNGCLYATTAHATSHSDYSTGFRCCATP